jgi:phenylpyruvate tautomerase PptA (4-oxalocrotonate tautomerase family)
MPVSKIEVRCIRPAHEIQALIDVVYQAQRKALRVPESDRNIRYIEHKPEMFAVPPGRTENYTFVEILLFPGRSVQAKRLLYQEIVAGFAAVGIDALDIFIAILEMPLENWGIRGGIPASDLDLGFNLNV